MHRLLKVIYNYIVSRAYIQKERKKTATKQGNEKELYILGAVP
jgi:hypothetical protein